MVQKDYYSILGVDKNASVDDIKKAYKKLCIKYHPDKWVNATEAEQKEAEEKFKEVNEAHSVLSDPQKRQNYDMFGTADGNADGGDSYEGWNPWGDGFDPFSRFRRPRRQKGADRQAEVTISFEEAYRGVGTNVTVLMEKECSHCHGTGSADGQSHSCAYCHGTGVLRTTQRNGNSITMSERPCPYCGGTGNTIKDPCPHCQGSGVEYETEQLYVDIPAGVYDGATVGIRGAGAPPKGGNGINGDLYVKIHVTPSEEYSREENNLVYRLKLNLIDAWCGCKRTVKCLDGTNISVTVPPLTKSGKNFIVKQRGFESSTPFGVSKGDFVVRVEYEIPSKPLTAEQKKALEKFYNLEK